MTRQAHWSVARPLSAGEYHLAVAALRFLLLRGEARTPRPRSTSDAARRPREASVDASRRVIQNEG